MCRKIRVMLLESARSLRRVDGAPQFMRDWFGDPLPVWLRGEHRDVAYPLHSSVA